MDILTTADVTAHRDEVVAFAESWAPHYRSFGRMDWDGYVSRLEADLGWDLPDDWEAPALKAIKRLTRTTLHEMDV